jgi:sugar phosphate isomerase/epimerase
VSGSIALSSFSLRQQLGPIRLGYRDEQGNDAEYVLPMPSVITLEEFPALAREHCGVDLIEICQIQFADASDDRVDAIRQALDEAGVGLLTIPIDVGNLADPSPERRRASEEANLAWFDIAARLGSRFVRINAGSPFQAEIDLADVVESFDRLADAAAARGLGLLVENHGGPSSDPAVLLELLETIGSDRLGLLLDTGNFEPLISYASSAFAGERMPADELDFTPVYERVELLAPHAQVVHAKAHEFRGESHYPVDLERALRLVRAAGFAGPVTVEYEGSEGDPWEQSARTVQLVRDIFAG